LQRVFGGSNQAFGSPFQATSSYSLFLAFPMESVQHQTPGHGPDLEKEGVTGQHEHTSTDVVHDAEIEKRVIKKLDRNLVPLVMAMCKLDCILPNLSHSPADRNVEQTFWLFLIAVT
jgi:hypothetical protein